MSLKLLVIISDRLSVLIQKGEVVARYYNPGNLFDEVHIMTTNDDQPDPDLVQPMVGRAKLFLHQMIPPNHFFRNTLGWQCLLMRRFSKEFLMKVGQIQPNLIRTHNNFLEGYLAVEAKRALSIPFVTSLHGVWDCDDLVSLTSKIHHFFRKKIEKMVLNKADAVICVYSSSMDYAKRYGCCSPLLIHNAVGGDFITTKISEDLSNPIRLITVNRQLSEKNPENIIKALDLLPYPIDYTIIGDGIRHEALKDLAKGLDSTKRITFIKALSNQQVYQLYAQSDLMVSHCLYKGISKTIIEAGLFGLPIILNHYPDGYQLEEYKGDWIYQCQDTPEGYADALQALIISEKERKRLSQRAIAVTRAHFSPPVLEKRVCDLYQSLLSL